MPGYANHNGLFCTDEVDAFIERVAKDIESDKIASHKHAQTMFIGPGGSGKSSLMYRMFNRRIPHPPPPLALSIKLS